MDHLNGYTQKVQQLENQNLESVSSYIQKVSPRDQNEQEVSLIDQNEILASLETLPLADWYSTRLTKDQQEYWCSLKDTYQIFSTFLKAKFTGEETPEWCGDKDYEDLFDAWSNCEIEFFLLIQHGWKDLKKIQSMTGRKQYPDTPRETFSLVLERDCFSMFSRCFLSRVVHKPRQVYDLNNIQKKLEKNNSEKPPTKSEKKPTLRELNKLKLYKQETDRLVKDFELILDLRLALLEGCQKLAKTSKNAVYLLRWKSFTQASKLHQKVQKRVLKKKQGHGWELGHFLESVKEGGTWKRRSS